LLATTFTTPPGQTARRRRFRLHVFSEGQDHPSSPQREQGTPLLALRPGGKFKNNQTSPRGQQGMPCWRRRLVGYSFLAK